MPVIEIKNSTASAQIKTLGAELTSFKRGDGFELLWQGDPQFWSGQAPVLFPIVGALRNARVLIKGQWYPMERHGFVRKREFEVTEQRDESVTLTFASDEESKKQYPYDFSFSVTYTVKDCALETKFTVKNTGGETLPFVVGGHPAYNIPVGQGEAFEDYNIEFSRPETQRCPEIDLKECLIDFGKVTKELRDQRIIPLRHDLFYRDALVFDRLNSDSVKLVSAKSGRGVEMDIHEFPMLGIWSCLNDGPYVALEPWVGCATTIDEGDEFEEKRNMQFLEPGGEKSYAFTTRYF